MTAKLPPHGDPRRYRAGCKCEKCLAGNAEYHRDRRAARSKAAADNVTPLPVRKRGANGMKPDGSTGRTEKPCATTSGKVNDDAPTEPGPTERAVIEECSGLSMAAQRPAMVATARSMAQILDNKSLTTVWPTASRQLTSILNELRGQSRSKRNGRLASVQGMTNRRAQG